MAKLTPIQEITLLSIAGKYPRMVDMSVAGGLVQLGLVVDRGFNTYELTDAGRAAAGGDDRG